MGYVKVLKNKAYFKRFQVQFRRRRENKTDYYARKRLIWQDKNRYDTPKFRLVVRFTNRDVICAVVSSDIGGDRVVKVAYGHELQKFGLKYGFRSWPATYATALLLARRVNDHFKLPFVGSADAVDQWYNVGDYECGSYDDSGARISQRRPFKAILDVGLSRTTTGSSIFAAVKGACDGGLNIPHSPSRFPGTDKETKETDFEVVRKYIFGGHIAEYMNQLAEEDEEAFSKIFSVAKANGITGDDIEGIWTDIHAKIRETPIADLDKKDYSRLGYFKTRATPKDPEAKVTVKKYGKKKIGARERYSRIAQRLALRDYRIKLRQQQLAAMEDSEDESSA